MGRQYPRPVRVGATLNADGGVRVPDVVRFTDVVRSLLRREFLHQAAGFGGGVDAEVFFEERL